MPEVGRSGSQRKRVLLLSLAVLALCIATLATRPSLRDHAGSAREDGAAETNARSPHESSGRWGSTTRRAGDAKLDFSSDGRLLQVPRTRDALGRLPMDLAALDAQFARRAQRALDTDDAAEIETHDEAAASGSVAMKCGDDEAKLEARERADARIARATQEQGANPVEDPFLSSPSDSDLEARVLSQESGRID